MDDFDLDFEFWNLPLDEQLAQVVGKLKQRSQLSPGELGWLINHLEGQRRPAHRPKAPVFRTVRGQKAQSVWQRMRAGMSEKAAISEVAERWSVSEATLRRECREEQSRIERVQKEMDGLSPELGELWRQEHPGKPEARRGKKGLVKKTP